MVYRCVVEYTCILKVMLRLDVYFLLIIDETKTKSDDVLPTIITATTIFIVLLFGCVMAGFFLLILKKCVKVKPQHNNEGNKLSAIVL